MSSLGIDILAQPLVFVDLETTGLDPVRNRVIEVAAIRVENGRVVREFSSLIDPGSELPYYITNLTGITTNELKSAPTFSQVASELEEITKGAIFVAHNVRFDYSFLKQEFKRLHRHFLPRQLCTVKLSRALYPEARSHKLEALITRFGFTYAKRHRAYDDAAVLFQFIQYIQETFTPEQLAVAIAQQLRQPAIPKDLSPFLVHDLPEAPGVYIFEDDAGQALYVGKSINIKKRVLSHFGRDHAETKEFKIAQMTKHIRTEQTPGELSALLREAQLVKELEPVYNRKLRHLGKLLIARQHLDEHGYITVYLEEATSIDPDEASAILAVYPRRSLAKNMLNELSKTFDLCPKLMGLEKASGACFQYQLHHCRGACAGVESPDNYNQRVLTTFEHQRIQVWPYKGAILLEEYSDNENIHAILVDKWCIVSEVTQEPYCEPVVNLRGSYFDLDTYKILQSYLTNRLRKLSIRPVDLEQLAFRTQITNAI